VQDSRQPVITRAEEDTVGSRSHATTGEDIKDCMCDAVQ
jgi:hypothetical protein